IAVWEAMTGGKVPKEYLVGVPEELRPLAEQYQSVLEGQYARVMLHIEARVRPILEQLGADRPALGRYLDGRRSELGYLRSAAFFVLDGKVGKLDQMVKELIYPRGNQFVTDTELLITPQ
ncbi:MAG TPA: hypothetical protein VKD72_13675, partial [Gemmataceae bacterium]|nr:hypothetical protein [Gemmataceae bacterium]